MRKPRRSIVARRPPPRRTAKPGASSPRPVSAFGLAVAAQYEKLYRRALALTRNPDHACELAQETVARALRFESKFTPGTNLHAWLQTMLGNLYLSEFRRARFQGAAPVHPDPDEGGDYFEKLPAPEESSPESHAQRRELQASLSLALTGLPDSYRWPLRLFMEEGLSYEQIAASLKIPVGTVMSRIYRARKLLQADLARRLPGMVPVLPASFSAPAA